MGRDSLLWVYCVYMKMSAPQITHGLKNIGFGNSMLMGIAVVGVVCWFLGDKQRRELVLNGLFR